MNTDSFDPDAPVWTLTITQFKELLSEVVREELGRRSDHVPTLLTARDLARCFGCDEAQIAWMRSQGMPTRPCGADKAFCFDVGPCFAWLVARVNADRPRRGTN